MNDLLAIRQWYNLYCTISKVGGVDQEFGPQIESFDEGDIKINPSVYP